MPIPTAQYRSYRKIPQNISTPSPSFQVSDYSLSEDFKNKTEMKDNINVLKQDSSNSSLKHTIKISTINYTHASNPNLVDFDATDFANKTHQFKSPLEKSPLRSESLSGFVTLEQFMLNKQKEDHMQAYSNRVICGVEGGKVKDINVNKTFKDKHNLAGNDEIHKQLQKIVPDVIYGQLNQDTKSLPRKLLNVQNRTLPKTPDTYPVKKQPYKSLPRKLFQSRLDDKEYEMIHVSDDDENVFGTNQAKPSYNDYKCERNRKKSNDQYTCDEGISVLSNKEFNEANDSLSDKRKYVRDGFRNLNSNLFAIEKSSKYTTELKPVTQYTPMNLPMKKIANQTVDINLDKR